MHHALLLPSGAQGDGRGRLPASWRHRRQAGLPVDFAEAGGEGPHGVGGEFEDVGHRRTGGPLRLRQLGDL
eukprot:852206-Pyramimonas_sp.AAC.1